MKLCYQKQIEGLAAIAGKLLLTAKPSSASTNQISLPNSNKYLKKINKYWHLVKLSLATKIYLMKNLPYFREEIDISVCKLEVIEF